MPAVLLGAAAQARIIASHDNLEKEALEKSAKVAIEGITNIRTVAGLGREADFVRRYVKTIEETHVQAQKKAHIRGKAPIMAQGFRNNRPLFLVRSSITIFTPMD